MKRKYYLRGIGIGIIFTAIVMSIAYNTTIKNDISDDKVIERAKELGMVEANNETKIDELLASTTPSPTPTEAGEEVEPANEPEPTSEAEPSATPTIAPEKQETELTPEVSDETDEDTDTSSNPDTIETKVVIEITEGMSSEGVAKLLKSKGIIEDAAAFNQYLVINKYTKDIRTGNYEIEPFLSYQKIADMIIFK